MIVFDEQYCNGCDRLTEKEWRIILNKTINCNGAELARMVKKRRVHYFIRGRKFTLGCPNCWSKGK
ncbi:MAG: hypothetical protein RMZ95_021840 [Nostoc sp. DedQUE07]